MGSYQDDSKRFHEMLERKELEWAEREKQLAEETTLSGYLSQLQGLGIDVKDF